MTHSCSTTAIILYLDIDTGDFYIRSGTTTRYLFDRSNGNFHADGNIIPLLHLWVRTKTSKIISKKLKSL